MEREPSMSYTPPEANERAVSDSSSRPMEREPSMSYTPPEANERAVSDSSSRPMEREPSMSYTPPVANERAELKDISFVIDGLEDTSCSTDNSPSAAFTRSGEQAELKRARGVRDPAYQREILQNRKIVWHADKGIWVSQKAPGGFDTVIEATMEV